MPTGKDFWCVMTKPKQKPPVSKTQTAKSDGATGDVKETKAQGADGVIGDNAIAGVGVRLLAVLYDGMLVLSLLFLVSLVLVSAGTVLFGISGTEASHAKELPVWYQNAVLSPSFVLTLIGFYGLFWRKSGQTLGMQTWRLQTLTNEGKLLTWGQSVVRIICACLAPMVCAMVGFLLYGERLAVLLSGIVGFVLNYLFCYAHPKGLSVHDWLSNTMTIRIPKAQHVGLFASFRKK